MPKRFDTHFYLVAADLEQQVAYDGVEITGAEWMAPVEALRLGRAKSGSSAFLPVSIFSYWRRVTL